MLTISEAVKYEVPMAVVVENKSNPSSKLIYTDIDGNIEIKRILSHKTSTYFNKDSYGKSHEKNQALYDKLKFDAIYNYSVVSYPEKMDVNTIKYISNILANENIFLEYNRNLGKYEILKELNSYDIKKIMETFFEKSHKDELIEVKNGIILRSEKELRNKTIFDSTTLIDTIHSDPVLYSKIIIAGDKKYYALCTNYMDLVFVSEYKKFITNNNPHIDILFIHEIKPYNHCRTIVMVYKVISEKLNKNDPKKLNKNTICNIL
jgi:hypothetical protein